MCKMSENMLRLVVLVLIFRTKVEGHGSSSPSIGEIVYEWNTLDYLWLNKDDRESAVLNKTFIENQNIMTGIKVYQNRVFVTVPRWRSGVPSTLNEVVRNNEGKYVLKPFPSWNMQTVGDCRALQYVQSMEIDPNTGFMWIIDVGRVNIFEPQLTQNKCRAKIVLVDINTEKVINVYEFPDSVAPMTSNFLNDNVLDYLDGVAKFAYISDTGDAKLIVYDRERNDSYFFKHSTMIPDQGFSIITIAGSSRNMSTPIDGIAMSPDFKYVYYCPLASYLLYRVPTKVLRDRGNLGKSVTLIGKKKSQSDGLIFSQEALYYGGLSTNAVYKLHYKNIIDSESNKEIRDQHIVLQNNTSLQWVDTFAIDESGYLWLVANRLLFYFEGTMNFKSNSPPNMFIWKIKINERSYLWQAKDKTVPNKGLTILPYFSIITFIFIYLCFLRITL